MKRLIKQVLSNNIERCVVVKQGFHCETHTLGLFSDIENGPLCVSEIICNSCILNYSTEKACSIES